MKKRATKLEYLEFFYDTADFGPAHEDVCLLIQERFENKTDKLVPKGYRYADDYDEE